MVVEKGEAAAEKVGAAPEVAAHGVCEVVRPPPPLAAGGATGRTPIQPQRENASDKKVVFLPAHSFEG